MNFWSSSRPYSSVYIYTYTSIHMIPGVKHISHSRAFSMLVAAPEVHPRSWAEDRRGCTSLMQWQVPQKLCSSPYMLAGLEPLALPSRSCNGLPSMFWYRDSQTAARMNLASMLHECFEHVLRDPAAFQRGSFLWLPDECNDCSPGKILGVDLPGSFQVQERGLMASMASPKS